jgi:hypothetical protein
MRAFVRPYMKQRRREAASKDHPPGWSVLRDVPGTLSRPVKVDAGQRNGRQIEAWF